MDFLGALNIGAGLADIGMNIFKTKYNVDMNKRDFDYQQALQQQIFQREDTAVQRRRADLEAAGFNPAMAAGNAAAAGSVVSRSNTNDLNPGSFLDTIAAAQQIKAQRVQMQIGDAEVRKANAEAAEKQYEVLRKLNYEATPYIKDGKIMFATPRRQSSGVTFYDQQLDETRRSWERKEIQLQNDVNETLSKMNVDTATINKITASIDLGYEEFNQRLAEFGFDVQKFNFNSTLETYKELRTQLETATTMQEKKARIALYLKQVFKMNSDMALSWSNLILDTLGNPTKCFNILGMLNLL